jgi:fructokinase
LPDFSDNDIVLFGSFFGIDPVIRPQVLDIIHKAREQGALVIYDPNFRKPHAHELEQLRPFIVENIGLAHIVRGSHEDFKIIFDADRISQVRERIGNGPDVLLMTNSSEGVYLDSATVRERFPVKKIKPISTIGAGDNFNAGLIYGLIREHVTKAGLTDVSQEQWRKITSIWCGFCFRCVYELRELYLRDLCGHIEITSSRFLSLKKYSRRFRRLHADFS